MNDSVPFAVAYYVADRFGCLDNKQSQLSRLNMTQSTNHFIHNNHMSYIKTAVGYTANATDRVIISFLRV